MDEKRGFVIAGTQSGCGKTTLSLGLMATLRARGLRVQPFKVGPDFIDPGLHTKVAGHESRNLDGWMLSLEYNRHLFSDLLSRADVAIVEGVMGLFDGYDGMSESGSSAEMAKWLGLPVVLVVDARSMARSAAALIYGFSRFDPGLALAGVLFNRIGGEAHLAYLKEAMAANLPEIPVLGGIPREESIGIPERHLGLVTADEMHLDSEWQQALARLMERYVNLDMLLEKTAYRAPPCPGAHDAGNLPENSSQTSSRRTSSRRKPGSRNDPQQWIPAFAGMTKEGDTSPLIAIARDAAFCFYYPDNIEMLRRAGARIQFFSPLAGENVPSGAAGLYLGGGYPELFAENLAGRTELLESIRGAASAGMPVYAECGGLMVLSRFIETLEGKRYPMAGILPFGTRMLARRKALGYTEVLLKKPCLLGQPTLCLRGHEFHYSEIVEHEAQTSIELAYELRKRKHTEARLEGYTAGSVLASYVHLHWGSAPEAAANFVKAARLA